MVRKLDLWKSFMIVPILFVEKAGMLGRSGMGELPLAEMFIQEIFFSNPSREESNAVLIMFGMFEIIIFNLLYGSHIYRDLYENTVYIFTRQKNRIKWLCKRATELFLYTMLYHGLYTGIVLAICQDYSQYEIDALVIKFFIITYVMLVLYTFWTTLVINLLAFRFGETISFIAIYIFTLLMSVVAIHHEKIPLIKEMPFLLKWNPVANVVIQWEGGIEEVAFHAVYFILLIAITLLVGGVVIQRMDIGLENKERTY